MRIAIVTLIMALVIVPIAFADTTSTTIGNTTYYSGDNEGTATKSGSTIYYNINGERGTEVRVGSTTYFRGELFSKDKE